MKGSIKDLLQIPGVQGYAIARGKNIQIKLPSKHRLANSKPQIASLYKLLTESDDRPGNVIEIHFDDMVITSFIAKDTMLVVVMSARTNLAMLRMTGKLVLSNLVKEK